MKGTLLTFTVNRCWGRVNVYLQLWYCWWFRNPASTSWWGRLSQKKHRVWAPSNRWLELGFYFTINSRTQENEFSLQRGPFSTSIFWWREPYKPLNHQQYQMFENSISSQPKCWKKALQACHDAIRLHRLNLGLVMGGSLGWCRSGRTNSAEASDMEWIRTGWWFQICFILTPTWGNDPIWLTNIFQMGWNHQLEKIHRPNFIFQPRCAWNNGISLPPFLCYCTFWGPRSCDVANNLTRLMESWFLPILPSSRCVRFGGVLAADEWFWVLDQNNSYKRVQVASFLWKVSEKQDGSWSSSGRDSVHSWSKQARHDLKVCP